MHIVIAATTDHLSRGALYDTGGIPAPFPLVPTPLLYEMVRRYHVRVWTCALLKILSCRLCLQWLYI